MDLFTEKHQTAGYSVALFYINADTIMNLISIQNIDTVLHLLLLHPQRGGGPQMPDALLFFRAIFQKMIVTFYCHKKVAIFQRKGTKWMVMRNATVPYANLS